MWWSQGSDCRIQVVEGVSPGLWKPVGSEPALGRSAAVLGIAFKEHGRAV